jgi:hypothetical protein
MPSGELPAVPTDELDGVALDEVVADIVGLGVDVDAEHPEAGELIAAGCAASAAEGVKDPGPGHQSRSPLAVASWTRGK